MVGLLGCNESGKRGYKDYPGRVPGMLLCGRHRPFTNHGPYGGINRYLENGKWNVITKFYMPKKRYEIAVNEDNVPYNIYREKGFLEISGENQVDYKDVYKWFIDLVKVYKIRPLKIGYDRYMAGYLIDDLKMAGFQVDDVYQGTNLTPILHQFEGDLKDGKYNLGDNTLLASHLLNVAVEINMNDSRMKPVKIENV